MHKEIGQHHEQQLPLNSPEKAVSSHEAKHHREHSKAESTAAEHDPLLQSVNALKARADQEAISSKDYDKRDIEASPTQSFILHRELKDDSYRQTLKKTQRHLSGAERGFSKVIHQPAIEAASNTLAATVGRPSGLFVGGLLALLGSGFLLYMSKRYGFSYNYGVFVLCLAGGMLLGLLIELAWRSIRRRH